jgi:multidrug resistance efflux pump
MGSHLGRVALALFVTLAFAAGAIPGALAAQPGAGAASASPATTASTAAAREFRLTGDLAPRVTVRVFARVAGLLTHVHFKEGSRVKAGDVMAEIDPVEYVLALEQARTTLESAQARLAAMEAGGRPEERARASAEVDSAAAVHRNATRNLERLRGLFDKGGVSRQALDESQREVDVTLSRLTSARKGLELVQEGPRPEDQRAARAEVTRARVECQLAEMRLSHTKIRAPFTGIVGQRLADPGSYLLAANSPQAPAVAVLSQSHVLRALVDIPERDMFGIRLGQPAKIFVQAYPGEAFPGTVVNLFPYVDRATRNSKLEIEVPNLPPRLLPGMFVEAVVPAAATAARSTAEVLSGRTPGQSELPPYTTPIVTGSEGIETGTAGSGPALLEVPEAKVREGVR